MFLFLCLFFVFFFSLLSLNCFICLFSSFHLYFLYLYLFLSVYLHVFIYIVRNYISYSYICLYSCSIDIYSFYISFSILKILLGKAFVSELKRRTIPLSCLGVVEKLLSCQALV